MESEPMKCLAIDSRHRSLPLIGIREVMSTIGYQQRGRFDYSPMTGSLGGNCITETTMNGVRGKSPL